MYNVHTHRIPYARKSYYRNPWQPPLCNAKPDWLVICKKSLRIEPHFPPFWIHTRTMCTTMGLQRRSCKNNRPVTMRWNRAQDLWTPIININNPSERSQYEAVFLVSHLSWEMKVIFFCTLRETHFALALCSLRLYVESGKANRWHTWMNQDYVPSAFIAMDTTRTTFVAMVRLGGRLFERPMILS